MTKDDKTNEVLKNLVKEIVGKLVYRLTKASAKNAVVGLRKKLKAEAIRKVEDKLKETTEERLEEQLAKSGRKLGKEIAKDNPQSADYTSHLRKSFEKDCTKFLSSLKGMSAMAVTLIAGVCALVVGGAIGGGVVYQYIEPTPTPQPDLIISEIAFEIEVISTEEPPSEPEFAPAKIYNITIYYVIENQGEAEAGQSTTLFYFIGEPLTASVGPLSPGEARGEFSPTFSLSEEDILLYLFLHDRVEVRLCADGGNDVEESNEENNCITLESNIPY